MSHMSDAAQRNDCGTGLICLNDGKMPQPTPVIFSQAKSQTGATVEQIALGRPVTKLLPGAITPNGKFALNPAVGAGGTPSLVVTDLTAPQLKVIAHMRL